MMGVPHKSWLQYFAITAKEYQENLQTCLSTQTRGKMNRAAGSRLTMATSASSLPEMLNVQHRTGHRRLDEQQVDKHGVDIVNYGDWAHQQRLNPLQREEDDGSDKDEEANNMELGLLNGTYAVHPPLGVISADRGIWQAPYPAEFV